MRPLISATIAVGLTITAVTGCERTAPAGPDPDGSRTTAAGPPRVAGDEILTERWTRLPDSPLSPRDGAAAAHVRSDDGDLAVFIGGYIGPPCPPAASCVIPRHTTASDGAAYHLQRGTWQPIADAPRPVAAHSSAAVIGDTVYVLTGSHLLAWDAGEDAWTELDPPTEPRWVSLVADTEAGRPRLVLASGSDENGVRPDQVYDPRSGTWSRLPADPLRPSFDRVVTSTPSGLVLTAQPIGPDGGPESPSLVHAAVLPRGASTWRPIRAGSDQLGGWAWTWTGRRLVDATPGGADGGEVDGFGRTIPYGGALDPATGEWQPLTGTPREATGGWTVAATGGRLSAVQGWIYDDGAGGRGSTWTRLPRPEGAPAQPGPAVWVDDVLVVSGGTDWYGVDRPDETTPENVWSTGAWAYRAR